jgi:hypothetical protein
MAFDTDEQRGAEVPRDFGDTYRWPTAGDTLQTITAQIPPHALVTLSGSGLAVAVANDAHCIGANRGNYPVGPGTPFTQCPVGYNRVSIYSDGPVTAGDLIKCAQLGRFTRFVYGSFAGATLGSSTGGSFANQPSNAGIQVVSGNAGDTTQKITIYGLKHGTPDVVQSEVIALNGTTAVASANLNYDQILGATLSASCAGTVTIQTTTPATITTILTTVLATAGYKAITSSNLAYNTIPTAVASGASTKVVGIVGTSPTGTVIMDWTTLAGTTPVNFTQVFATITALLFGDPTTGTTVTVATPTTADDPHILLGEALDTATAAGQLTACLVNVN